MTGIDLIALERARQTADEGWTPEHDDQHRDDEIAVAAACYATPPGRKSPGYGRLDDPPLWWPWEDSAWKPGPDRVRELTKAGALIAAEIDRLARAAAQTQQTQQTDHCGACGARRAYEKERDWLEGKLNAAEAQLRDREQALKRFIERVTKADEAEAYGDDYEAEIRAARDEARSALDSEDT